jgi:hypothetical protein
MEPVGVLLQEAGLEVSPDSAARVRHQRNRRITPMTTPWITTFLV